MEKKPGSLLLIRPEVRMMKELNEKEIVYSAERAAERGDHAAQPDFQGYSCIVGEVQKNTL